MSYLNRTLVVAAGLLAAAGTATAQQPVVVRPPITNPAYLRVLNPVQTTFVPGVVQPPMYGYWGGPYWQSGFYRPPTIVQNSPGRFIRLPDGKVWNPTTGSFYSPWSNTFSGANGTYYPNPWTGTYTNPVTGGSYNPWNNTVTRPWLFGVPVSPNPWSN